MSGERGFSVVELLVASAILFVVSGAVLGLLHDGLAGAPVIEESTDLHQRARVVADVIAAELRVAAAGTPSGPMSRYFAAILTFDSSMNWPMPDLTPFFFSSSR